MFMKRWKRAACALLLLPAAGARACYMPPPQQMVDPDDLVATAPDVVLARVLDAAPGARGVAYHFVVEERLAGPARPFFTIADGAGDVARQDTSFAGHTDPAFWERTGGRTMNGGDCAIHPGFVVGATYLIFQGVPATRRSYEKIETVDGRPDPGDAWLQYVRRGLRARAAGA